MSIELILVHIGFIVALVYFVFRSGQRSGREEMVSQLIEDKFVDPKAIITFYRGKEDTVE